MTTERTELTDETIAWLQDQCYGFPDTLINSVKHEMLFSPETAEIDIYAPRKREDGMGSRRVHIIFDMEGINLFLFRKLQPHAASVISRLNMKIEDGVVYLNFFPMSPTGPPPIK